MRKVNNVLAPAMALVCLLLAGCGKESKTVKIAVQMPLSGPLSVFGVCQKNSAQLAVEQLSEPLKKLGFSVELASYDDQANPDTGVANAKAIISDPTILGVVAHWNSGVYIPSSEVYHSMDLAAISPGTSNPKVTDRGYSDVNRVCGRDDVQGAVGAAFAKDQGFKSVYVLHDKQTYGQGIAEFFRKECETAGIRVPGLPAPRKRPTSTRSSPRSWPPSLNASTSGASSTRAPCCSARPGRKGTRVPSCPTMRSILLTPPRSGANP